MANTSAIQVMPFHDNYELLDFGDSRKLERFGDLVLDRPCPAAEGKPKSSGERWPSADGRFLRSAAGQGRWKFAKTVPETWTVVFDHGTFELKCAESGQIGLFAEQAENWAWIAKQIRSASRPLKVLNLFAYTGGATMAAAHAGAEVAHVDAARNAVEWARRNGKLSGLDAAPIRWVVEDAAKFARRELRRGNRYDAVILDPPSYGHGPQGEVWKIQADLLPLLETCAQLTAGERAFLLLTCHSAGFGPAELQASLASAVFGHCQGGVTAKPLYLRTPDGRKLHSGVVARWPDRG